MTKQRVEQDLAAGGAEYRKVRLDDGRVATASVEIRVLPRGYQEWAWLRFKAGSKTSRRYIGKVTSETRELSLALAWRIARENQVIEKAGWSWLKRLKKPRQPSRIGPRPAELP